MTIDIKSIKKEDILGVECRFAVHCLPNDNSRGDLHLIKEVITLKDNTQIPNVRLIKDYKRPFYVSREAFRNYEQKKEWTPMKEVMEYKSTQADLVPNIAKALNVYNFNGGLRRLARSPFLYGADILSTALIKKEYQVRFPDIVTPFKISTFDVESDVIHGTNDVIMATLSFGEYVHTAVLKSFFDGYVDVENRLRECMQKHLGDIVEKRNIKWSIDLVDSPSQVIISCFNKAHELKPDIMAIWNMDYDVQKIQEMMEKEGIDPGKALSDPCVPDKYKHFRYKQGPKQKVTASGKVTPIKPAAQWHTVYMPASFYIVDAMCAYKHIRTGKPEEVSYSLDYILNKHIKRGKLKFTEADHLTGLDWHKFMQSKYKFEYVIYNVFDCVSMELLDEQTNDLRLSFPMLAGCSDFENFKSQPRRVVDQLHFYVQEHGYVMGTTSDQMSGDDDDDVIGLDDWIKKDILFHSCE